MNYTESNTPLRLLRAGVFLCLALATTAPAQTLRLGDVLTTKPAPTTEQETALTEDSAHKLFEALHREISEGRTQGLSERLERLQARVPAGSTFEGEALWLRARGFEFLSDPEKASAAAAKYLAANPQGGYRLLCLGVMARAAKTPVESARLYHEILATETPDATKALGDPWKALDVFSRAGDGAGIRKLLSRVEPANDAEKSRKALWLVESLLIDDDTAVVLPLALPKEVPEAAALELRRGLLLDLRGEAKRAATSYQEAARGRTALTPEDAALLAERLAAVGK